MIVSRCPTTLEAVRIGRGTTRWTDRRVTFAIVSVALLTIAVALSVKHDFRDVVIYHGGAKAVLDGGDLYGFRVHGHGFTYPPFAALLLSPLGVVPVSVMWCVLAGLSGLALVVLFRFTAPGLVAEIRAGNVGAAALFAALVLAEPVVAAVQMGQVDLVLAALVGFDLLVHRRGVLVGLATALKLTPGLFVVYLLLRRRWREAGTAMVVFLATVGLGAIVMPGGSSTYWRHFVFNGDGTGGFATFHNQSIRGLAERTSGVHAGTDIWLALAVPVVVAGLWLALRAVDAGLEIVAVGVVGVTACLLSPLSWIHHWVWLFPVFGGLWARAGSRQTLLHRWPGRIALLWAVLPNLPDLGPLHWTGLGYPLLAVLLAWLVLEAIRDSRSAQSSPTEAWYDESVSAGRPTAGVVVGSFY